MAAARIHDRARLEEIEVGAGVPIGIQQFLGHTVPGQDPDSNTWQ